MRILAIDPGKSGGLCFWGDHYGIGEIGAALYKMPLIDGRVDVSQVQQWIIMHHPDKAIIETQFIGRRQGSQAVIMQNYGRLTAVLDLCGIPYEEIEPKVWQAALGLNGDKLSHIEYAISAGYDIPTKEPRGKVLHDGIADACCIAEAWWLTKK